MSVKKEIFKKLGDHLKAKLQIRDTDHPAGILTPEMDLPGLAWFDKQMGQFSTPEQYYGIPLPGILMEYGPFTWNTIGKKQQKGVGVIRFYIYFENYADSFTGSINQEMAMRFFEFTEQVHLVLQGYGIKDKLQALDRVADNEDSAQDMVITSVVEYNTVITDRSTDSARNNVLVDPDVNVTRLRKTTRPEPNKFTDGFVV